MSIEAPRALAKTRVIRLHEDDGQFDRAFWRDVPPARRLELAWELVLEYLAWRSPDAGEPRPRRSACRVERRAR